MTDTQQLLADYVRNGSETAFRELVTRYVDLVYSVAFRLVNRDAHLAQDIAQTVFVDLARIAPTLSKDVMLGGWLHRHTCYVASTFLRGERRRQLRENEAVQMNALHDHSDANLAQVAPILDEAINQLGEGDRTAIMLRFFAQHDFRTVGAAIGTNEDAARMRVNRALEKLHSLLKNRGVTLSAGALATALTAQAVTAAPIGLAATISTAALSSTATLIGVTKTIAMTTLQKTLLAATLIAAVGTGLYQAKQASALQTQVQALQQQQAPLAEKINQLIRDREDALRQLAALRDDNKRLSQNAAELPKLRSTVTRLNAAANPSTGSPAESAAKSWLARVEQLKERLKQNPEAGIPEFQLLSDEDWLGAVKGRNLSTEKDYRRAFSYLRNNAESKVASMMQPALSKYMKANNGQFPSDLSQLQPYFESPLDEAILQRFAILPAEEISSLGMGGDKVISQKAPVDAEYDQRFGIGPNGYGSAGNQAWNDTIGKDVNALKPVMKAYAASHNSLEPTEAADLMPYATTPEQQAALQRMIKVKEAQASAAK
ncbi:RNA polymerase sigma factor [Pedosphaera parvula]|uniref:RNA polymerase, sigma-24 subunit, ECF subfamily n=1 Tax=Pedosphaera parvula (strain Ellin514) TaxID=320771 RepID=B9XBE4_PEDPL|nr:sigma-70 family RNA polymerase sigma factor [Pedosphaera parvula]EEF62829.1 RNA polymerase, sigma-24 subunit, ECF subfamily [Pedosphaera parvula Ellin514]